MELLKKRFPSIRAMLPFLLLLVGVAVDGHSTHYDCTRPPLDAGLTVMGQRTVGNNARKIQVFRGEDELSHGDKYYPGETLNVVMSDTSGEQLLETSGGSQFHGGICASSTRYVGGSTNLIMPNGNSDVLVWGGWAQAYGVVSITEKFLLESSGVPATNNPTSSTTDAPTSTTLDSSFSVLSSVDTNGVTTEELEQKMSTLGDVFCDHLSLAPSNCLVTFISENYGGSLKTLKFDLLITNYATEDLAINASSSIEKYIKDPSDHGFIEEFFNASSLHFSSAAFDFNEITEVSSSLFQSGGFSCDLSENLKLSWEVESQGDGTSIGEDGGYITGSLTMLSEGSSPWFSGGVVENGATSMVESPEHVVYFYEPISHQAGMRKIIAHSSSGILPDNRIRADTGIIGRFSGSSSITVEFQQSRITDVATDPTLALDSNGDFNTIIWAHGGIWPAKHTSGHRGFSIVYWLDGKCIASEEDDPTTWREFMIMLSILLGIAAIVVNLDSTTIKNTSIWYHFRRTLRQVFPSCIPLTHDIAAFTLRSSIAVAAFLLLVILFVFRTADFYEDEKGYDPNRSSGYGLGFGALFCAALTVVPVNKTGLIVTLFKIPFDRATKFHRVCGGITMILVLCHAIKIADFWGTDELLTFDTSKQIGEAYPAYGVLAACCFGAMAFTAPYPMRSRAYELFQVVHLLFFPAFVLVMLHIPEWGKRVLIGPLCFYGIDLIYRAYQVLLPVKVVSVKSPYNQYVVLKAQAKHIRDINPGQFCFVNVPSASLFQWHPISICSYDRNSCQITFIIKNVGDWTGRICDIVNGTDQEKLMYRISCKLIGPFGRIRFNLGADAEENVYYYEKIVLIAGGIGCTPMISTLQWLIDNAVDMGNEHRLHVTFLMSARDREMLLLFAEYFKDFNDSNVFQKGGIDLRLHCTTNARRSEVSAQHSLEIKTLRSSSSDASMVENVTTNTNLSVPITYCRPDIEKEIKTVCEHRESDQGKVCVLVCGPAGIVTAVQNGCHAAVYWIFTRRVFVFRI